MTSNTENKPQQQRSSNGNNLPSTETSSLDKPPRAYTVQKQPTTIGPSDVLLSLNESTYRDIMFKHFSLLGFKTQETEENAINERVMTDAIMRSFITKGARTGYATRFFKVGGPGEQGEVWYEEVSEWIAKTSEFIIY